MKKTFVTDVFEDKGRFIQWHLKPIVGLVLLAVVAGCQTQPPIFTPFTPTNQTQTTNVTEIITLREGDVLKISFPGSANLNTTQPIRRDGMISMPLVGEVKAVGKTPAELKKDLIDLYSTQLVSKEVTVEVQSSLFPVYVNGSVLHPGKIMSDHPMTAFDAIMEAGGFDYAKANLKRVVVIRQEGGRNQKYTLNLKLVMDGKPSEPFYVKPGDTITVPEKFQWF
jgi:polysaccharide export outer membrane protein